MGFEVCTYCAARLSVNELATWILFVYIQSLVFFAGMGFSVVTRSAVQERLEKNKKTKNKNDKSDLNEAKELAKAYLLYLFVIGGVLMLLIIIFNKQIAAFFT